jgi:hypothetical protein
MSGKYKVTERTSMIMLQFIGCLTFGSSVAVAMDHVYGPKEQGKLPDMFKESARNFTLLKLDEPVYKPRDKSTKATPAAAPVAAAPAK